ncbi:MAG: radical SAM protein [Clostridia bacterium]|jgi:histone acetyltransferase (RNA polymerase elongator complex component)|nr:radical SAM protein [Clostridia bacterium]
MKLIGEIFIGSLTGKSLDEQREILEKFRENNRQDRIKISIVPNLVNKEQLKMLKSFYVTTIELEVQSTNGYILKKCGYEYTIEDIKKATRMIKWKGFKVSFQVRSSDFQIVLKLMR